MAHKLTVHRGTTWTMRVEYLTGPPPGTPASFVGATLRFTVKSVEYDTNTTDTTAILAKNVTSHVDAAGGISQVALAPSDTAALTPGEYFWDLKVEHNTSTTKVPVYTLDSGRFSLEGTPTNRVTP